MPAGPAPITRTSLCVLNGWALSCSSDAPIFFEVVPITPLTGDGNYIVHGYPYSRFSLERGTRVFYIFAPVRVNFGKPEIQCFHRVDDRFRDGQAREPFVVSRYDVPRRM